MAEQTQQADNAELETLRRTNEELLTKSSNRKAKIAAQEATIAELKAKLAERDASLRQVTIDSPLRQMCESISTVPELFQEQLLKHYKLEMTDGKLTLLSTTDGQPVQRNGKSVPFERDALVKFLTDETHPHAQTFRAITIASRASGGAASTAHRSASANPNRPAIQFGLR